MLDMKLVTTDTTHTIYELYLASPHYFQLIGSPTPNLTEVEREVAIATWDKNRRLELLYVDHEPIGFIDYKINYPETGDVTINLLLITEKNQHKGYGRLAIHSLEERLSRQALRILAGVYGHNPPAQQFWKSLGYHLAINAKPVMEWYAKPLAVSASNF